MWVPFWGSTLWLRDLVGYYRNGGAPVGQAWPALMFPWVAECGRGMLLISEVTTHAYLRVSSDRRQEGVGGGWSVEWTWQGCGGPGEQSGHGRAIEDIMSGPCPEGSLGH